MEEKKMSLSENISAVSWDTATFKDSTFLSLGGKHERTDMSLCTYTLGQCGTGTGKIHPW